MDVSIFLPFFWNQIMPTRCFRLSVSSFYWTKFHGKFLVLADLDHLDFCGLKLILYIYLFPVEFLHFYMLRACVFRAVFSVHLSVVCVCLSLFLSFSLSISSCRGSLFYDGSS